MGLLRKKTKNTKITRQQKLAETQRHRLLRFFRPNTCAFCEARQQLAETHKAPRSRSTSSAGTRWSRAMSWWPSTAQRCTASRREPSSRPAALRLAGAFRTVYFLGIKGAQWIGCFFLFSFGALPHVLFFFFGYFPLGTSDVLTWPMENDGGLGPSFSDLVI